MARLRKNVGIITPRVRLPRQASIGPALVKTGATVADYAQQRGQEDAIKQATEAAQALNFERDSQGNLIAPQLPTNQNGLVGPTIYDEAYTQQVLTRYKQQIDRDAAKHLQDLASDERYMFDPQAFEAAAQAYVEATADAVLPQVAGDVRTAIESRAVNHQNHIVRRKSEQDFRLNTASQQQAVNDELKAIDAIAAMPNKTEGDMIALLGHITEYGSLLAEGAAQNYWLDTKIEEGNDLLKRTLSSGLLISKMHEFPDTREGSAAALEMLNDLVNGDGMVPVLEGGTIKEVPVKEIFANTAERLMVTEPLEQLYKAKEMARREVESSGFEAQNREFYTWYSPMAVDAMRYGKEIDRETMYDWHERAVDSGNTGLAESIRNLLNASLSGGSRSFEERQVISQWQKLLEDRRIYLEDWMDEKGYATVEDIPPEELIRVQKHINGEYPGIHGKQNDKTSALADEIYAASAPGLVDPQTGLIDWSDPTKLDVYASLIETMGEDLSLIPRSLPNFIISTISDPNVNSERFAQAMYLAGYVNNQESLSGKMQQASAFGNQWGESLQYILNNLPPGSITSDRAMDIFENWESRKAKASQVSPEQKQEVRARLREKMAGREHWFAWDWFLDRDVAPPPQAMQDALVRLADAEMHKIQDGDIDTFLKNNGNRLVDTVMQQHGWSESRWGYSPTRHDNGAHGWATDRWGYGWVQNAPEQLLSQMANVPKSYIEPLIERRLKQAAADWMKENPGITIKEGDNVSLAYNAELSDAYGTPFYSVMITNREGYADNMIIDSWIPKEELAISFSEEINEAKKQFKADEDAINQRNGERRRLQQGNRAQGIDEYQLTAFGIK